MRAALLWCSLTLWLTAGVGAQSAPQTATPETLRPLNLPDLPKSPAKPAPELYAPAFSPENPVTTPATALLGETRTPTQLEALLATYAGTWRGEISWYNLTTHQTTALPTEMVYALQKQNGRNVLNCTITYHNHGQVLVALSHLWVENDHIFSEISQEGVTQKFVAQSHGSSLSWRTFGSIERLLEFSEVETLRLTASGGELSSYGFEVQYGPNGRSIALQSSELKLVK